MKQKNSTEPVNFPDPSTFKAIAMGAGDLSTSVRLEVKRVMTENKNHLVKAFESLLHNLADRDLISANESKQLQEIFVLLLNAIRGKGDVEDAYFSIKKIYNELILDKDSSAVAIAIASVAGSSFNFAKSNSIKVTPESTGAGALLGAGIGAGIGSVFGPLGAGIGAVIGGAAGAAIGFCNENGV